MDTDDRDEVFAELRRLETEGRAQDELDIVHGDEGSILLRPGQSAARSMMAESGGRTYRSFRTLGDAKAAPIAAVMIEGDYGGQIFATCPVRLVGCSEERLRSLAEELETRTNATDYAGSAQTIFEPIPVAGRVAGGMGGGRVVDGVWVHEEIRQLGWAPAVEGIILGTFEDLGDPRPLVTRAVRDGVLRAYSERIDVFAHVFGFDSPVHLRTVSYREQRRLQDLVVPPPADYAYWYPSTLRAVLAEELSRRGSPRGPRG